MFPLLALAALLLAQDLRQEEPRRPGFVSQVPS